MCDKNIWKLKWFYDEGSKKCSHIVLSCDAITKVYYFIFVHSIDTRGGGINLSRQYSDLIRSCSNLVIDRTWKIINQ